MAAVAPWRPKRLQTLHIRDYIAGCKTEAGEDALVAFLNSRGGHEDLSEIMFGKLDEESANSRSKGYTYAIIELAKMYDTGVRGNPVGRNPKGMRSSTMKLFLDLADVAGGGGRSAVSRQRDSRGALPLHVLACSGNAEVYCMVRDAMGMLPPGFSMFDSKGLRPFFFAAERGHSALCALPEQSPDEGSVTDVSSDGWTAIYAVVRNKWLPDDDTLAVVRYLEGRGAKLSDIVRGFMDDRKIGNVVKTAEDALRFMEERRNKPKTAAYVRAALQ